MHKLVTSVLSLSCKGFPANFKLALAHHHHNLTVVQTVSRILLMHKLVASVLSLSCKRFPAYFKLALAHHHHFKLALAHHHH